VRLTPSPRTRIYIAIITTAALYIVFSLGSLTEMTASEAERRMRELGGLLPPNVDAWAIFSNNMVISLLMLIPLIGPVLGGYIVYNTGTFLAAISISTQTDVGFLLILPLLSIYGLLEFMGYGAMTSESVLLIYAVVKKRLREELRALPLVIGVAAAILGLAALIEFGLISIARL